MTRPAANMMAHAGEIEARYTPTGEARAPAMPAPTPTGMMQVLLRMWVMHPEIEMNTIENSEVAVAPIAGKPKPKRKAGTMMVPPPTPSMPESTPIPTPTIAATIRPTMTDPVMNSMKD